MVRRAWLTELDGVDGREPLFQDLSGGQMHQAVQSGRGHDMDEQTAICVSEINATYSIDG